MIICSICYTVSAQEDIKWIYQPTLLAFDTNTGVYVAECIPYEDYLHVILFSDNYIVDQAYLEVGDKFPSRISLEVIYYANDPNLGDNWIIKVQNVNPDIDTSEYEVYLPRYSAVDSHCCCAKSGDCVWNNNGKVAAIDDLPDQDSVFIGTTAFYRNDIQKDCPEWKVCDSPELQVRAAPCSNGDPGVPSSPGSSGGSVCPCSSFLMTLPLLGLLLSKVF